MEVSGFPHQVGGHFGLLSIPGHVCKPFNQREYDFYSQMDPRLQPFTAKLCNRIKVQCSNPTEEDGSLLMMSTEAQVHCHGQLRQQMIEDGESRESIAADANPPSDQSSATLSSCSSTSTLSTMGSYTLPSGREQRRHQPAMNFRLAKNGRVETAEKTMGNLWAGQCQNKVVQKLLKGHDRAFILLEDLVANYTRPCVIDLKMGTRQYGDDASVQKRLTQTQKCRHSTSSTFGVRLVGMQLFEAERAEFAFVNKYEGRRMDRAQLNDALLRFFKMAGKQRSRRLIQELLSLREVLLQAEGFRFFSSSLLIAYDGERSAEDEITLKMIDFAHSTFNGFLEDAPYTGFDEGYLLGIDSLIKFLTVFLQTGFKPIECATAAAAPGQICSVLDGSSQKRTPLKRKLENGSELAALTTPTLLVGPDEESSLSSSVGFTSGDSGTEMGEPEEEEGGEKTETEGGPPPLLNLAA